MDSGVLESYRTLGLVCDDKAFKWHREGESSYLSLPLGRGFLTYKLENLKIRYIGCQLDHTVNAVESYKDLILVAAGKTVSAFHKVRLVKVYLGSEASINEILVFGQYLVALNFAGEVKVWDCESAELLTTIPLPGKGIHLLHPPTYLNKVLVSMKKGRLVLLNVKTGVKIYDFPNIGKNLTGEISALENAVALDIVAIGLDTGKIVFGNVLKDEVLFTFDQTEPVTSLSVCSMPGFDILASVGTSGYLNIWDLKNKKIQARIRAHNNLPITKVMFVPNESLILTSSSADNSIKQWVFDFENPEPRIHKKRDGFNTPPNSLRFYNTDHILAISENSLRDISLLNEHQSCAFSSKNIKKSIKSSSTHIKLPSFNSFASSSAREKDWCNIITCNSQYGILWNYDNKAVGEKPIEKKNKSSVLCSAVSECGNFGILALEDGSLEKFNMQSGFHQLSFSTKHNGKIVGVEIDSTNSLAVSASDEGEVYIWDFVTGKLVKVLKGKKIRKIRLHKASNLLAVAVDDGVDVLDVRNGKLARSYDGDRVGDLAFTADSRWLAYCDETGVRIWDLPSDKLIDWVSFPSKVIALDFSLDGRYLATAHSESLGVFLWLNKSYYTQVIVNRSPKQPRQVVGFDVTKGKNFYSKKVVKIKDLLTTPIDNPFENVAALKMPKAITHSTFKTSEMPINRIHALFHLDEIKERNAPIEPPKKPEKVPFFLPDTLGIITYNEENKDKKEEKKEKPHEKDLSVVLSSPHDVVLEFLKSLAPGKIELNLFGLVNDEEVQKFIEFLYTAIDSQNNYDFLQSVLGCFLRIHSDKLSKEQAKSLADLQQKVWKKIEEIFLFDISGLERLID